MSWTKLNMKHLSTSPLAVHEGVKGDACDSGDRLLIFVINNISNDIPSFHAPEAVS